VAGGREENTFCFGGLRRGADVHLEAKSVEACKHKIRAGFEFLSGHESEHSIIYIEHTEDLEGGSVGECFSWVASDSSGGISVDDL